MKNQPFAIRKEYMKGILCILLSSFFFSMMSLFIRLAGDIPTFQKAFFRNAIAGVISTISLLRSKEKFHIKKGSLPSLLCRAAFGTAGLLLNFWAIDNLALADANILNKLSPFFAIIVSYFLLKEIPSRLEWLCVILAFGGALFIVKPTPALFTLPALGGLASGLGAGIAYSFVRKLGKQGERGAVIVFCFSIFSCLVTAPMLIFDFHPMTLEQTLILALCGISAAGGQFSITAAYTHAPAKEISVFDYTQVVFAGLIGLFVFSELPDIYSFIGYGIIFGAAILKWYISMKASRIS